MKKSIQGEDIYNADMKVGQHSRRKFRIVLKEFVYEY